MLRMTTGKNYGGDLCKSHSARSEKEFCRVCPANLNKKELENVYFTLLENNLDLKTTINSQREKIKILSTKLQRLTALQKTYLGNTLKDCCGSKALIDEQKECISELRRSNQCLSERVRQLNMRLCSAKQFLKRSPFQSTSRCNRCSNKNASMSALISKRSETNLRTRPASSQYLVKDIVSSRIADNVITSHEKSVQYDLCDENKCREQIEELKEKNKDLQEELSRMKENHDDVTSRLERDACQLRAENVRVRSERALADERTEQLRVQLGEVTVRLGSADLRCDELSVELAVEKRKVSELETRLKAADMSCRIAHVIETHLTNIKIARQHTKVFKDIEAGAHENSSTDDSTKLLAVQSPQHRPKAAVRTRRPHGGQIDEVFKGCDDSGYAEANKSQDLDDTKASTYVNQLLLEKVADLQNQINILKSSKIDYNESNESANVSQEINSENASASATRPAKQPTNENIISESSESVVTEKKTNTQKINIQQNNFHRNDGTESETHLNNKLKAAENFPQSGDNKIEDQQVHFNADTNDKENLKDFKKLSKDVGRDSKLVIDGRKLSLQGSRVFYNEKNVVNTGSLDESRIIKIGRDKNNGIKRFEAGSVLIDNFKENQVNKSSNDYIASTEEAGVPDKNIQNTVEGEEKRGDIKNVQQYKTVVENEKRLMANLAKDEKRKDSDSSKGTYTIEKDQNEEVVRTKPKDAYLNVTEANKKLNRDASSHKDRYTLAADFKKVINVPYKYSSKDKLTHRRRSTSHAKAARDTPPVSPDSTECEISSMSDLPSERDARSRCSRSPGEERPPTATTDATTTDYGSLSEGELPYLRDVTILSDGEKRFSNKMDESHSVPAAGAGQTEATLAAVRRELARCGLLLAGGARGRPASGGAAAP